MTVTGRAGPQRRSMVLAVAGCLGGAGLALLAVQQDWAVEVTRREPPLSPLREGFSGADLLPWLPALALVALAAGAALLATRRGSRLVVAGIAAGCGLAIAAGAGYGATVAPAGERTVMAAGLWPLACLLGGLVVVAAGLLGIRHGRSWPSMGARYERSHPGSGTPGTTEHDDPARLWDALDAGGDPTRAPPEHGAQPPSA
ncbi:MAG TPA: Trp biosynthesis-associated membrane protein [Micromonosporaceae bacterium]